MQSMLLDVSDDHLYLEPKTLLNPDQIKSAITALERKVIWYKSACQSVFCRPNDRKNLSDVLTEIQTLNQRLALI